MERGHLGPNESCEYYPCHYAGQDCSFCYCPFYPCEDGRLGLHVLNRRKKKVWDCSPCLMIHDTGIAKEIYRLIDGLGISEPGDPRFKDVFDRVSKAYFERSSAGGDPEGDDDGVG